MRFLLVGDSHKNQIWWAGTVEPVAAELGVDGIIQLGDFGYLPDPDGRVRFVQQVAAGPLPVWFLDGNHEHHPRLAADVAAARARHGLTDPQTPVPLGGNLHYLPRGGRLELDGVRVAALGGAVSIDRGLRVLGYSWFAEEVITDTDLENLAAGGPADVLLCHDAPAGHVVPGLLPAWQLPDAWRLYQPLCEEHRVRVREGLEVVRPQVVVHGHYHTAYVADRTEDWGPVQVVGLSDDGTRGAFAVLEVAAGSAAVTPVQVAYVSEGPRVVPPAGTEAG